MKSKSCKKVRVYRIDGFTLVELLVVIVILGLLSAIVGQQVVGHIVKAKISSAKTQIVIFKNSVNIYKIDTGQYPEGLVDLIEEPPDVTGWSPYGYLDGVVEIPMDPWGNDYNYYYTGEAGRPFEISSFGADGKEGGEDNDADIYDIDISGPVEK